MATSYKNKNSEAEVYENEIYDFLISKCKEDLKNILNQSDPTAHYPILLNFVQLHVNCSNFGTKVFEDPDLLLPAGDKAACRALRFIYDNEQNKKFILKTNVHIRIHSMPEKNWDRYTTSFPGCKDVGTLMTLVGTVVRTGTPKLLEFLRMYKCSKCKQIMHVEAPASRYHAFPKSIDKCENLCVGGKVEPMESETGPSNSFRFRDYQEIKLQEQVNKMDFGEMPKSLWVILENDLINSCKPGDDVVITGSLFLRFKPFRVGQKIQSDLTLKANHVEVKNDQRAAIAVNEEIIKSFDTFWTQHEKNPFVGRNEILKSFCTEVYGMYIVKLAFCVVLCGGVSKEISGNPVRAESHLLLVGDPGTGKSQLLRYASQICPRSVMTTGTGTTSAGLTVSAVKDSGEWHLEAGALVLADGGICCIDEFSNIKEHDRVSIHEAMEQQSISVAKAGIVCKLNTKCTVLAATNPKLAKYDPNDSLEVNIGLASPLLSRFDLIIVLKDAQNESWDDFLSDFVLNKRDAFEATAQMARNTGVVWDCEKLQSYLVLVKDKNPELTDDAFQILGRYYKLQRNSAQRNVARTTVRLLESLYRLAEGHARFMYRDSVIVQDALMAVCLVEASMQTSALASIPNPLHSSFPADPLDEYYNQAKALLQLLDLPDIWKSEKLLIENFKQANSPQPRTSSPPPPPVNRSSSQAPKYTHSVDTRSQKSHCSQNLRVLAKEPSPYKQTQIEDEHDDESDVKLTSPPHSHVSTQLSNANCSNVVDDTNAEIEPLSPIPIENNVKRMAVTPCVTRETNRKQARFAENEENVREAKVLPKEDSPKQTSLSNTTSENSCRTHLFNKFRHYRRNEDD